MKHPKLKVSLTVIKKMVMFNIVEIPSVIFSPKRWKRDSTEHRDDNYYAGCDRDDDTWLLIVFEKHCENDNGKHYNVDDSNGDHDDNTADDFSGGDLTIKSRKFGSHPATSMTTTRIMMILQNDNDSDKNGEIVIMMTWLSRYEKHEKRRKFGEHNNEQNDDDCA